MNKKASLILANGTRYDGYAFGAIKTTPTIAEVVFTTNMVAYEETLTDPSYYGQIVVQTFPLIGNYGVIPACREGDVPRLPGYIVREWCENPSNFSCDDVLDNFLKQNGIPGLYGIDTRSLTRKLRSHGVMNGAIVADYDSLENGAKAELLQKIKAYKIENAVENTATKCRSTWNEAGEYKVALLDFGHKYNIARELEKRGCAVTVFPASTSAEEILAWGPDGVMLSNGPGDPAENTQIIENLKQLADTDVPIFGICLGHQLLALAAGAKTEKLAFGHRGANQPVTDLKTGRTYITSQNHGYAVVAGSIPADVAALRFVNGNDKTTEGVDYVKWNAFTTQFHPEACGGPEDTMLLFDRFIDMMK